MVTVTIGLTLGALLAGALVRAWYTREVSAVVGTRA